MGEVVSLRRGRPVTVGRRFATLFPSGMAEEHRSGGHWLYAIGLPDGRVKIGKTSRPRARFVQHAATYGVPLWVHLFCRVQRSGRKDVFESQALDFGGDGDAEQPEQAEAA